MEDSNWNSKDLMEWLFPPGSESQWAAQTRQTSSTVDELSNQEANLSRLVSPLVEY
jgi:hypothetical protein